MIRRQRGSGSFLWQAVVAAALILSVAACGSDENDDPTPSPSTTPELTVGELADRIAAAWTSVSTYRMVSRDVSAAVASTPSPAAGQPPIDVMAEVIVPDRKRQVSSSNGETLSEYIVVGDQVWVRGTMTEEIPSTPVGDGWSLVDPSAFEPSSPWSEQLNEFIAPVQPLYAGLSDDERSRIAKPLGEITVDGQACQAYQIVDTTQTGERVDVTLAMNADDLPCSIQTKVGGVDFVTTFEFNIPLTITPPVTKINPFT